MDAQETKATKPPMPGLAKGIAIYKLLVSLAMFATVALLFMGVLAALAQPVSPYTIESSGAIIALLFIIGIPLWLILIISGITGIAGVTAFKRRRHKHLALHYISTGLAAVPATLFFVGAIRFTTQDAAPQGQQAWQLFIMPAGALLFAWAALNCVLPGLYYAFSPHVKAYMQAG